jgi:PAS domain S-box-containing protein
VGGVLSELPYRDLVQSSADALFLTDLAGECVDASEAGANLFGLTRGELIGRNLYAFAASGSPQDLAETNRRLLASGSLIRQATVQPASGTPFAAEVALSVTGPGGYVLVRVSDRSRELEMETVLRELSDLGRPADTPHARTRHEVAEVALAKLCEATGAAAGAIINGGADGQGVLEASRGMSAETAEALRAADTPQLAAALAEPEAIVALESIRRFKGGKRLASQLAGDGLVSGLLVGLRQRDETIGRLVMASREVGWARPHDDVVIQAASRLVSALEDARLVERLEQGLDEERRLTAQLEALVGLTLLPQGEIDERTGAQHLVERVVAALGADGGLAVKLVDGALQVIAAYGAAIRMARVIATQPAEAFGFWRRLRDNPDAGAFQELVSDLLVEGRPEMGRMPNRVAAYSVFPIREGGKVVGAFICHFAEAEGAAPIDAHTIEAVGRIISIAYSNIRMSHGLNEAAEHERRLTAQLRALQELTLLGASTDDLRRLSQETIEAVVVATGAAGGGYILVDQVSNKVEPIIWVGQPSASWPAGADPPTVPADWPPLDVLSAGIWLSRSSPPESRPKKPPGNGAIQARLEAARAPEISAQAVLPLRVDDRLAGVLHLEWSTTPWVEQLDGHFLEPIARISSISLANFRLRSELLHRAQAQRALGHRLDTLDELTRIGEEASSFEELAHRTVSLVREALGAAGVSYLLIEAGHHFETHAVAGETGAFRQWLKGVPAREVPGGSLLLSGGGSSLGDFEIGQVSDRVLPLARATGFLSYGAIPIRTGEELAGALLCFFEQPAEALTIDEAALDSVARIGGIALANFRLRERLVASEERYRTLFEESPNALFVSALDGTVLDTNEAAVRLYRVNRGEVLGRYFGQFISADEREMARRRQIVWTQGRGTFRDRGRRPDSTEFPVEVEVRVVELGGQRRFLSLVRDLSDQERLTNELLQAQKMEAIGQLVSGVAHELNNPLAAIIAFSQLIRADDRLPDDMKHDAGLLVQESDRTRRIVQNLLDFARQRPPERRPTSIGTLVRSVLELQSYALNTNRIQVVLDVPESLPEVDLDRAQLQQVLLNLTINAIQAIRGHDRTTPAHLWVSAALARPASGRGAARTDRRDEPRVRITIRDDGPGVPESARPRLFDPFFTTKEPGEGTGLGLSVSFGSAAAPGGRLWYEPGPGDVGACFIIELPVHAVPIDERQFVDAIGAPTLTATPPEPEARGRKARPAGAPAAPAEAAAGPEREGPKGATGGSRATGRTPAVPPVVAAAETGAATQGRRPAPTTPWPAPGVPHVLALDDEPSIRAFLRKALAAAGMACTPSPDGASALDALRDTPFDVMLIDHRMAGMSGTEFYEAAVAFRPELASRAIFMSGDVLNPDLKGFATKRGIRLLAKPFDIEAVVRVVCEVLEATAPKGRGRAAPGRQIGAARRRLQA